MNIPYVRDVSERERTGIIQFNEHSGANDYVAILPVIKAIVTLFIIFLLPILHRGLKGYTRDHDRVRPEYETEKCLGKYLL